MSPRETSSQQRIARIEQVEERIVLSATPWPALALHGELVSDIDATPTHEVCALPEGNGLDSIAIAPQLGGAHSATGVDAVRAEYGFDGTGQTVVVIDSGIAYDHYALGAGYGAGSRVVGGWDFAENDADPYDDAPAGFHGTHVAGIIGSDDATYTGVASGVDLVALRVFDDSGNGSFEWVDQALQWVIDNQDTFANPITTVNLSLGVPGANYADAPVWAATLDAKFQTLNEAGIFVAVSAGNDFEMFNAKGLSYPAVSDWVIPVASGNDAGTALSSFSQRDDHVLVAPGESITSTVPDELFSFDGTPNDWASASGTSMASPYVAGVSVLVREAYAFMGEANVDQGMIYDSLFDTANLIFDPITGGNYHFIDVEAALESIITDSLADDSATATDMGMMGDGYQFSEVIGKMTDQDYFSFVAESTGTMSFTVTGMTAHWDLSGGGGSVNGNTLTFNVVAGQTYTLGVMNGGGMSHYDVAVELEEGVVDWGTVERNEFNGVNVSGEQWYSITATRTGLATIEASNAGAAEVTLEFYTGDGQQLMASDVSSSGYNRVDANVLAGETILVRVLGNGEFDFNTWNIVGVSGSDYEVLGTSGNDVFTFFAGTTHQFSVNGLSYSVADGELENIMFDGDSGTDSITAIGDASDDFAKVRTNFAMLQGDTYEVRIYSAEQVNLSGGGGYNTGVMFDTAFDDELVATPESVTLAGGSLSFTFEEFSYVKVNATNAGIDTARVYDSDGDDFLTTKPDRTRLVGDGFNNYFKGFEEVFAYASNSGKDWAKIYDSVHDDLLVSRPEWSRLTGDGFDNYVEGFDRTSVYATAGGYDQATMYDSIHDDLFTSKPEWTRMSGSGYNNFLKGFEKVHAHATMGGSDRAKLFDSINDDLLTADAVWTRMSGNGFDNTAEGFEKVVSYAYSGGYDTAVFQGAITGDSFFGRSVSATVTRNLGRQVIYDFDVVAAYADSDAETPSLDLRSIDYLFESYGNWL